MKIGDFSKKFNVSVATIRHYINLGLLVPEKDGFQYKFNDNDCHEMEIITDMKASGFKLSELSRYMSILRLYNKDDYLIYEKLINVLNAKKDSLYAERRQINTYISAVNRKIDDIKSSDQYTPNKKAPADTNDTADTLPGFPLSAVSLLYCPHCRSKLSMSNVDISGTSITNGSLSCQCGYSASIRNGIMYTDSLIDLENDPTFLSSYFGDYNLFCNEDGIFLMGMDEFSNEYLTAIHRESIWIDNELKAFDTGGKTILFPDMSCQYLYSHYNNEAAEDCIFLVTALSERSIRTMRHHIANVNPNLNIAYIIDQNGQLPLRQGCIDIIVDYMGSLNLGFFGKTHYFNLIAPYIAEDAVIIGTFEYYRNNSPSIRKIHELYLNSAQNIFTKKFTLDVLADNDFEIVKTDKIMEGYEPGAFFEYHIPGDIRTHMIYLARRKRK